MSNFELERENIGKRITEIRKAKKLTQDALAQKMGVSRNTIINYESSFPKCHHFLYSFKEVTGASLDYLFTGKESITEESLLSELLSTYKQLPPEKQEALLIISRALK